MRRTRRRVQLPRREGSGPIQEDRKNARKDRIPSDPPSGLDQKLEKHVSSHGYDCHAKADLSREENPNPPSELLALIVIFMRFS